MKKIIAILAVFAALLSLSACKVNMTAEEKQAKEQAEISKNAAASIKAEEDFSEGYDKEVDKLGKTEKGKRLVVKEPSSYYAKYLVLEFGKKEGLKNKLSYRFFPDAESYDIAVEGGDGIRRKLVEKDDKARMVVFEIELSDTDKADFDFYYGLYASEASVEAGYEIVK